MASYAQVVANGPKQTPEEAAAPQLPTLVQHETASTSSGSLVDVDSHSVRTVPSDYAEQDVQTSTQAQRLELEEEAKEDAAEAKAEAKAKADKAKAEAKSKADKAKSEAKKTKDKAVAKAKQTDSWITKQFASLNDGQAQAAVGVNLAAVVGLSAYLGYKAWGLYEKGRLSWQAVGLGAGVIAVVGLGESVFAGYWAKARGNKQ